jgi:hypothetical protein
MSGAIPPLPHNAFMAYMGTTLTLRYLSSLQVFTCTILPTKYTPQKMLYHVRCLLETQDLDPVLQYGCGPSSLLLLTIHCFFKIHSFNFHVHNIYLMGLIHVYTHLPHP